MPTVSASRFALNQSGSINLNAPNSTRWYKFGLHEDKIDENDVDDDASTEHNGLTKNRLIHDLCLHLLGVGPRPDGFEINVEAPFYQSNRAFATQIPVVHPESYYLEILGVSGVYLRDENNNFSGEAEGFHIDQAEGVTYDVVSESQASMALSTAHTYTIRFRAGSTPFRIRLTKGIGSTEPNNVVAFQDVFLQPGTEVKLVVGPQGIGNLLYDADGNGTFESVIVPTVSVIGQNARDITPPTVSINMVPQGNLATVTLAAQDNLSGVREIRYSLNGTNFSTYSAPFTINYSTVPVTIFAFADDNAINRSGVITRIAARTRFDFDRDGRADISIFRPSEQAWHLNQSTSGYSVTQFGLPTDVLTPADYDGDGKADIAVYRDGTWYLLRSSAGFIAFQFGLAGDVPQPADFDGDGLAELVVYRNGTWYSYNIANGQTSVFQFGLSQDKPVVADYDGDGKADYALYRPDNGVWFLAESTQGFSSIQFGIDNDIPLVGDFDGDGKSDLTVFRPSERNWYIRKRSGGDTITQFGLSTDLPVPADYDGDGKSDIAVFRDGTWYLQQSRNGLLITQFGLSQDKPVPNVFVL